MAFWRLNSVEDFSLWYEVNGPGQACRGAHKSDNLMSYYEANGSPTAQDTDPQRAIDFD